MFISKGKSNNWHKDIFPFDTSGLFNSEMFHLKTTLDYIFIYINRDLYFLSSLGFRSFRGDNEISLLIYSQTDSQNTD